MKHIYLAIALLTLTSRLITLAGNLRREVDYHKRRKNGVGKHSQTGTRGRPTIFTEDGEFYGSTDYDFRDRF